jgi:hypothetical protein
MAFVSAHRLGGVVLGILTATCQSAAWGQGVVMPAAGAVNRSMAGASVAAPLDALGAIY